MTERTAKLSDERQEAILARVRLYKDIGESGNADLMARMERAEEVTLRDQWSPEFREEMERKGKVCLSVPMIRPQIKQAVGYVVQNPKDVIVYNLRGGMRTLADLLSALIQHTMTDQHASQQMIQWFDQASTTGCSYLAALKDMDSDPLNGDLEILKLNEFQVLVDPTCQDYDLSKPRIGAKFVQWHSEVERSYVEQRWPEALEAVGLRPADTARQGEGFINWLVGVGRSVARLLSPSRGVDLIDFDQLRYPVVHTWWIDYRKAWFFYDHRSDELDAMILTDKKEIQAARDAAEAFPDTFTVKEAVVPQCNHTITLGTEILLDHIEDEFDMIQSGQALIPVVRLSPNWNNGYASGMGEDLIGLQEFINWTFSIGVNLMKNQGNSGWFVKSDDGNKAQWLRDHGNEDNVVIKLSDFGGGADAVTRMTPAPMPDFIPMTQMGMDLMRQVSNVRTEMPEKDTQQLSGRAILAKQEASLTGVSPIYSNYDYSLALWGRLLATIIRCSPVYSDSEIREIVEEKRLLDPQLLEECRAAVAMAMGIEIPPKPEPPDMMMVTTMQPEQVKLAKDQYVRHMANYDQFMAAIDAKAKPMAMKALIDGMRNARRGRYHCRVALSPQALTMRTRNLMELANVSELLVANQARPLSDKNILEASDLPNKDEILEERGYQ